MQSLKDGAVLKTTSGESVRVKKFLSRGGQGEVYVVVFRKKKYALKVFFDEKNSSEVAKLIGKELPHPAFIFPDIMLDGDGRGHYPGYVMTLVDTSKYVTVRDIASGKVPTSLTAIVTACCNFARAFGTLERAGLCYKDLNLDNLLWCPTTGEIVIIDPDNISFSGSDSFIDGTFGTMAPEIIRRECGPSSLTDLYSLSVVILYMLTMGGHPLEGKAESGLTMYGADAQAKLHGVDPLYVWDPKDDSNRPCPQHHERMIHFFGKLPSVAKRMFQRAFTTGLVSPNQRIVTKDWLKMLTGLRDATVRCPKCKKETFVDIEEGKYESMCSKCNKPYRPQHAMRAGESEEQTVLLSAGSCIFGHHFEEHLLSEDTIIGHVSTHPKSEEVLAFKNVSSGNLHVSFPSGTSTELPPKKSVVVQHGLKVVSGNGRVVVV